MSEDSVQGQEENERYKRLRNEKILIAGLFMLVVGFLLTALGSEVGHQTGTCLIIFGVLVVIFGLARYVSKRISDENFWWTLKTGPFPKPL